MSSRQTVFESSSGLFYPIYFQRSLPDKAGTLSMQLQLTWRAQHPVTDVMLLNEIEAEKDKQEKAVEAEDFEAAQCQTRRLQNREKVETTEDTVTKASTMWPSLVERMVFQCRQMGASDGTLKDSGSSLGNTRYRSR